MEKMRMESVDMTTKNIDKIAELFPNCITETIDENGKPKRAINFELLRQMLSEDVIGGVMKLMNLLGLGKKRQLWRRINLSVKRYVLV